MDAIGLEDMYGFSKAGKQIMQFDRILLFAGFCSTFVLKVLLPNTSNNFYFLMVDTTLCCLFIANFLFMNFRIIIRTQLLKTSR